MAYVDDENERTPGAAPRGAPGPGLGGGVAPTSVGAPTVQAGTPAQRGGGGTGFVNLERYLTANQGAGQGMANQLASNVNQLGQTAQQGISALQQKSYLSPAATLSAMDPKLYGQVSDDVGKAAESARATQTAGGVGGLLTNQYGAGGGYGSGMRGFDTFLTRAEGNATLEPLAGKYGGLDSYLGTWEGGYTPATPTSSSSTEGKGKFENVNDRSRPMASTPGMSAPGRRTPVGSGGPMELEQRMRRRVQ